MVRDRGPFAGRVGLRARTSAAFALLALVLSVGLAAMTYTLAHNYLLSKRIALATREASANARIATRSITSAPEADGTALVGITSTDGAHAVVQLDGRWYAQAAELDATAVPAALRTLPGQRTEHRTATIDGNRAVVVAVPFAGRGIYYEIFPLTELESTLRALAIIVTIAAATTTLLGAALGRLASRRLLRPMEAMAQTAERIADDDRETRLTIADKDLAPFTRSFNDMVDALEERIDREARFASDVSHELRTPLTAMSAAIDVLDRRVGENARPALDTLRRQIRRFERLVLDLLEISRMDTAADPLALDVVEPAGMVRDILDRTHHSEVPVIVEESAPAAARLDRRRIDRVLANLLDNADHYAGGPTRLVLGGCAATPNAPAKLTITVDDAGPGIVPAERERVLERFHRGESSRASTAPGTGLGLSIAAEHCRVHGGSLAVLDSPDGGARLRVELPLATV